MRPLTTTYAHFVPTLIGALFAPADRIRIAVLHGPGDMRNEALPTDQAIARLRTLHATPNVYFACAALDGNGYAKHNCLHSSAFCVDIDYGRVGHRAKTFFDTVDDAWAVLMTAPVTPTAVWHTGHGLQALYLLREPYRFDDEPAARITAYETVSRKLAQMVQSDATFTPEHLFRVPLTVNAKPDTPPIHGTLLRWDPTLRYRLADLQAICDRYGVPDDAPVPKPATVTVTDTVYADLPEALRFEIESDHLDRSGAMFALIVRMVRAGYDAAVIHEAIRSGPAFADKYGTRLHQEIDRCLDKLNESPHVYVDSHAVLDIINVATTLRLAQCDGLPVEMADMLNRYARLTGITLSDRVRESARFHQHLLAHHQSGVMETPCGYGKSTWAISHMAVAASPSARYLYVVDTIDTLYHAAALIERLNPSVSVGRYHAFNADRCFALCGTAHDWRQCDPSNPQSACRACEQRTRCAFRNRDHELERDVVVMCHNGFVRLLESESAEPLLERAHIIIDEDLNAFLNAEFTHTDLLLVERYVSALGLDLKRFFPYTSFAVSGTPNDIKPNAVTFASIHYVHRDERETGDLGPTVAELRKGLGVGKLERSTVADLDRARQTLCELLSFFRPAYRGDATYAYREIHDQQGIRYLARKNRFNLGIQPPGRKLWILNASAQLSPYPASLPVYRCPDLPSKGHLVSLHVIAGNPMQSKHDAHVATACRIIREICLDRHHTEVFVATDKGAESLDAITAAIRDSFGAQTRIVPMERGRIRGRNEAGNCTFACLVGLSLFSSIDNVGATAAIVSRRTIPVIPWVFTQQGRPSMPGGRFRLKTMRELYALSALDELYQTLWRTAVRNDRSVEAIVVMPDAEWLSVLWRTVMPGYRTHAVYEPDTTTFRIDLAMDGLVYLMGVEAGREFAKQDIARLMGYGGQNVWKENQARIMALLDPFFEDGQTIRMLRRKAEPRSGNGTG